MSRSNRKHLDQGAYSGSPGFALAGVRGGQPLPLVKLVDNFDAQYSYVANEGTVFTFHTNFDAPLYRYARCDPVCLLIQCYLGHCRTIPTQTELRN